jgi:glycosyltransferase involved in cell wall biosynthesis
LRALIVSDLNPKSGWGRAAYDLSRALVGYGFEVLLYPIHDSRKKVPTDIATLSTTEFVALCDSRYFDLIIHFDLPTSWVKYKHAKSIGYFFWESGSLPKTFIKYFQNVDQIWVPSNWQKNLISSYDPNIQVFKIPIPITGSIQNNNEIYLRKERREDYVLWMGTLEPRKGLRNFLREWSTYKTNGGQQQLKLKVSSNNFNHTWKNIDTVVNGILTELKFPKKYLNSIDREFSSLPRKEIENLYINAKSVVGSSFGEGFGFVPVDGTMSGIPVFWPSNTATAEWLPLGNIGAIECVRYTNFLKGDQALYENPIWYPPLEGAIEAALWTSEGLLEVDELNMRKVQLQNLTNFFNSTDILAAFSEIGLEGNSGGRK